MAAEGWHQLLLFSMGPRAVPEAADWPRAPMASPPPTAILPPSAPTRELAGLPKGESSSSEPGSADFPIDVDLL